MEIVRVVFRMLAAIGWVVQLSWGLVLDALTAQHCAACDHRLRSHAAFCASCAITIRRLPTPVGGHSVDTTLAYGSYGGALADALARLKYRDRPDLARPLSHLLLELATEPAAAQLQRCDVVVPVPLHPRRLAQRGYNQAALLARPLARYLGRPMLASVLRRLVDTPAQALLDAAARRHNVAGAFGVRRGERVRGKVVLLVDDVCTTGATLSACAAALRSAGADAVVAIVVARRE